MKKRKVIVEPAGDGGWLAMAPTGDVRWFEAPADVLRSIRRHDAALARRGVDAMTVIEWRDVPPGFIPPEVR